MIGTKSVAKAISSLSKVITDLKQVVEVQQGEITDAQVRLTAATKEKAQAERILDKLEDLLR